MGSPMKSNSHTLAGAISKYASRRFLFSIDPLRRGVGLNQLYHKKSDLCEAACPSRCIKVISEEDKAMPLQRYATEFYIDITKCVFCGYCVEACPVNALAMTKLYEFSTHDKRTLMFDKERLYDVGERYMDDAKKYLYAHNQEKDDAESRAYRYHFPESVLKPKDS